MARMQNGPQNINYSQQFHHQTTKSQNHLISRVVDLQRFVPRNSLQTYNLTVNSSADHATQLLRITEIVPSDIFDSIPLKRGLIRGRSHIT